MGLIRVLCFSDTHLGFDSGLRARSPRRRRGPEFLSNYLRVLRAAENECVDFAIHCGDFFYRSRISRELVFQMIEPLARLARRVPVFIVPGNHERSALPFPLFWKQPNLHVFDRPRSFLLRIRGHECRIFGFPFVGRGIRSRFRELLSELDWTPTGQAGLRLLVLHELIEGVRVGPAGRSFGPAPDVIAPHQLQDRWTSVLCGHVHRHQVFPAAAGRPPILLPGSTERTSFAEAEEEKGYLVLEFETGAGVPTRLGGWRFEPLPSRPMITLELPGRPQPEGGLLLRWLAQRLRELPADAILRLRPPPVAEQPLPGWLSAPALRRLAPPTMNVDVAGQWGVRASPGSIRRKRYRLQAKPFPGWRP